MFVCPLGRSALVTLGFAAGVAGAQVKYPAPAETSQVDIRYRIRTDRDERVRQFRDMTARFTKLGFVENPRDDGDLDIFNADAERFAGTMPTKNARELLDDARVQTVLVRPSGYAFPDDAAKGVEVRLGLAIGFDQPEQRQLHEQALARLAKLGFRENVGYDHGNFTRVRGAMPGVRVPQLLKDLRDLPAGWFLADEARDQLPGILRRTLPIRIVEVLPEVDGLLPFSPVPAVGKVTLDLRNTAATNAGKPIRVEATTLRTLPPGASAFRATLRSALPTASLEGVVGNVATIRLNSTADLDKLAQLPEIVAVRTPSAANDSYRAGAVPSSLAMSNVAALHAAGYRGTGVRVVIAGANFASATSMIGNALPRSTRVIDLTAELSPDVTPAPAGNADATPTALAVHAAAPGAELVLVRVDPSAFHQTLSIARKVVGDGNITDAVRSRGDELDDQTLVLGAKRDAAQEAYRQAFRDLSGDDDELRIQQIEIENLKKEAEDRKNPQELVDRIRRLEDELNKSPAKRRNDAKRNLDAVTVEEAILRRRSQRLTALRADLESLRGTAVVVNTLVWDAGQPGDGQSELGALLEATFTVPPARRALRPRAGPPAPSWIQAASEAVGSAWAGPLVDVDGNGVLEFAPAKAAPAGTWTPELNFLSTRDADGKPTLELAANTAFRVVIQWREPRNPETQGNALPRLAPTLRLLRQLDPTGAKAATDELAEVARSGGVPVAVQLNETSGVFEQTLNVVLPATGRYALRVEDVIGKPGGLGSPRDVELSARIVLLGPVTFRTFAPTSSGVGVPGDLRSVITVANVPSATAGAGAGVVLLTKPDLLFAGSVGDVGGAGVAAGYVAGVAACLAEAGVSANAINRSLGVTLGTQLVLPRWWIDALPTRFAERK